MQEKEVKELKDRAKFLLQFNNPMEVFTDPILFASYFFPHHIRGNIPDFHKEIYSALKEMRPRQLVVAPRGTAKSTIISFVWVLFNICFRLASLILLISDSFTKSCVFLDRIKREVETNEELRNVFQISPGEPWSRGDMVVNTPQGSVRLIAKGVGQSIRGLVQDKRIELVIIDDVENEENTKTKASRDSIKRWFYGQVLPAVEPKTGRVIVVGTNIHYDSLIASLLNDKKTWKPLVYSILKDGKSIWEERFPTSYIKRIEEEYAKQGMLAQFYAEYLNQPIPPQEKSLDLSLVRYFDKIKVMRKKLYYYMAVDLAASMRKDADNTAIAVVSHDDIGNIYVMDLVAGKLLPSQIVEEIIRLTGIYPIIKVGVEAQGPQLIFYNAICEELNSRGIYLPLYPIKHRKAKKERIIGYLEPKISSGRFYLNPAHSETDNILDELKHFSEDKEGKDDRLDAIAMAISLMEDTLVSVNVRDVFTSEELEPAPIYLP